MANTGFSQKRKADHPSEIVMSDSTTLNSTPFPNVSDESNLVPSKKKRKRQRKSKKLKESRKSKEETEVVQKPQRIQVANTDDSDESEIVSTSSSTSASSTDNGIITLCQKCPTENPLDIEDASNWTDEEKMAKMTQACRTILSCVGEDPNREGLLRTPQRWAKALLFMTRGYHQETHKILNGAVFSENHREMVLVRDIDIHSLCEHHMLPFTGKVHVAYIPNGKVLGLSKIARIAEVYARRLQVQERLTRQIADAMVEAVNPLGVAVVVDSNHFCMVMRGVQKTSASTVTSCVRGCFEKDAKTRAEFFSIINSRR